MTASTQVAYEDDLDYEIVNGHKEVKMAGARHGRIGVELITELNLYLRKSRAGHIYTPDTTFQVGAVERLPDIGFVSAARIPAEGEPMSKWEIAPDLAIEIISPTDIYSKVMNKVREYFAAGVQQVWLVTIEDQQVTIYDSLTKISVVTANKDLTSETLLPGFKCRVSDLFTT